MFKKAMYSIILSGIIAPSFAQNIEQLVSLDKNIVKIGGGMNFSSTVFQSDNEQNNRDPFAWYASGNITFNTAGMSFPFSYSISNQGKNLSQPSNITALHPSYKWVKTHVGRINMSFSPYTMSGINFSGAGVELTPKRFSFQAMYGQLAKSVAYDANSGDINAIAYERWGYGMMFQYRLKMIDVKIISFKAADNKNSLLFPPGQSIVKPKDNLVTGLSLKFKPIKNMDWEIEMANSILTNNTRYAEGVTEKKWYTVFYPIVNGNGTTDNYNAIKSAVNYTVKTCKLGFTYERVDPNYQTLGALYFTNDMENLTFSPSFSLLKNKINIALNTGLQRNNLNQDKVSKTERWVGSTNVSLQLLKGLTSTVSYSNFSSFTRNNPLQNPFTNQNIIMDTCNVYQVNENVVSSLNYSFGKKNKTSIMTSFTYQTSSNVTGQLENASAFGINVNGSTSPFKSYINMMGYTYTITDSKLSISLNANSNLSKGSEVSTWYCGPTCALTKSFGKEKPKISGGVTYNRNYTNSILTNNVFNYRMSFSHAPKWLKEKYGSMNFSANAMLLHKLPTDKDLTSLRELTVTLNLAYTFK